MPMWEWAAGSTSWYASVSTMTPTASSCSSVQPTSALAASTTRIARAIWCLPGGGTAGCSGLERAAGDVQPLAHPLQRRPSLRHLGLQPRPLVEHLGERRAVELRGGLAQLLVGQLGERPPRVHGEPHEAGHDAVRAAERDALADEQVGDVGRGDELVGGGVRHALAVERR